MSPNCISTWLSGGKVHLTELTSSNTFASEEFNIQLDLQVFSEVVCQGWGVVAWPWKTGRCKYEDPGLESKITDPCHVLHTLGIILGEPYSNIFYSLFIKKTCYSCCLFKGQRWPGRLTRGIKSDSRWTETVFNIKHNHKSSVLSMWFEYPDAVQEYSPSFIFNQILAFR